MKTLLGLLGFWNWNLWTYRRQLREYRMLESRLNEGRTIEETDTLTLRETLEMMNALQAENDTLRQWCAQTQAVAKEIHRRMEAGQWPSGANPPNS